ncbi:MAG: DUF3180 domain-containing protein [Nocardioidaceae bacterium]
MRDQPPPVDPEPGPDERIGQLRPLKPVALVGWAVLGLVVGWFVHPLAERWRGIAPTVSWLPSLAFLFVAVFLALTARSTLRAMRGQRPRPQPHQMVNRFVAARASALVGSLFAGGYVGYALSWLGSEAQLAPERVLRSLAAAAAAALLTVAAGALERACRVSSGDRDA